MKTVDFVVAPSGWTARTALPDLPSGEQEADGGWLAYNAGNGLFYAAKGNKTRDFYAFNAGSNSWTTLKDIPDGLEKKQPLKGCRGVADGNDCIYMTKGANTLGFWSYAISTNTWLQLPNVPSGANKVNGGTDLAYVEQAGVGYVYLLKGQNSDFYRYNTTTGIWETDLPKAPDAANPSWPAGSWLVCDGDHTIYAHKATYNELWTFDLGSLTWGTSHLAGMPLPAAGDGSAGAWLDGNIYALRGGNTSGFCQYVPTEDQWNTLSDMPPGASRKRVQAGGDITATGNMLFAFKGNKTNELWRYVPAPEGSFADVTVGPTLLPSEFALSVSPNPIRLGAAIRYSVPVAGNVSLKLYDITGALAKTVSNGPVQPGRYTANLSAKGLARGVYILKLESGTSNLTRKVAIQ